MIQETKEQIKSKNPGKRGNDIEPELSQTQMET